MFWSSDVFILRLPFQFLHHRYFNCDIKLAWRAQEWTVLVVGDVCLDAGGLRIAVSQEKVEEGAEDRG